MAGKTIKSTTEESSVTKTVNGEEETYEVYLPKLKGNNAKQVEFFSINGQNCLLKRGENIKVSKALYEIILNAQNAEREADDYSEQVGLKEPK